MQFTKRLIDGGSFEAAWVFDVDGDGIPDIVCGGSWYKGPDYSEKHFICDVAPEGEYYDDFCDFGMDVNGDGFTDIITGGWWGATLRWRRNPGAQGQGPWEVIDIDACGSIETIRFLDIDGCGTPEIFPNTPGEPQAFYKLAMENGKGTGSFEKHVISEGPSGHGLGFGDINGDGHVDIVLSGGWLENPGDPFSGLWRFHPEFDLGSASVPVLVHDVDGDGLADLIVGQAHNYGLAWYRQVLGEDGVRVWEKHDIDTTTSQYHDMVLFDIDGDGDVELVTGRRYRAHCGNDPGDNDPVAIYWFDVDGGAFTRHTIDFGDPGEGHSGLGIYFWIGDLRGDGGVAIVAPGKEGLYLFERE